MKVQLGDIVMRKPETIPVREDDAELVGKKKKRSDQNRQPQEKMMRGTVVYSHPQGRFHTVAFQTPGGIIRESFLGVER